MVYRTILSEIVHSFLIQSANTVAGTVAIFGVPHNFLHWGDQIGVLQDLIADFQWQIQKAESRRARIIWLLTINCT